MEKPRPTFPGLEHLDIDPESVRLNIVGSRIHSDEYIAAREEAWNNLLTKGNNSIWNGSVYTIAGASADKGFLNLDIGICEYKDIIFKEQLGYERLIETYGTEEVSPHIVVACIPLTKDGKIIVGERHDGVLDLIGGTLNEDEMTISSFADFKAFMVKEFKEEVALKVDQDSFSLFCINSHSGRIEFIYVYELDGNSDKAGIKPGSNEFSSFLMMTPDEIFKSNIPKDNTLTNIEKYL